MNRSKFISQKILREPEEPTIANLQDNIIAPGQRWKNQVNGSFITIISKTGKAWLVEETYERANGRVIDSNGTKDVLESFILNFYKLRGHE